MASVWVKTNDIFNELKEENKRLLKELIFAKKCLKVMFEFKLNFDLNATKIKSVFVSEEWKKFEELNDKIKRTFNDENPSLKTNSVDEQLINDNKSDVSYGPAVSDDNSFNVNDREDVVKNTEDNKQEDQESGDIKPQVKPVKLPSWVDYAPDGRKIIRRPNRKRQCLDCSWPGCDYTASHIGRLKTHLNAHKGIRPFKCRFDGCDKAFTSRDYLRDHMKLHTARDSTFKISCEFEGCGKRFRRKCEYVEHKNKHLGLFPFKCEQCPQSKGFVSEAKLRRHYDVIHKILDQPLVCSHPDCNRQFKTAQSYKIHQQIIHNSRTHKCQEPNCDYKTTNRQSLMTHIRSAHTKERPFKCHMPGCDKDFAEERYVTDHIKRCHINDRPFHCTHEGCTKTYKTKNELSHHERIHLGIRFYCDWPGCEYGTTWSGTIKTHKIMVHLGERNFRCNWPECGKAFKSRSALTEHQRIHKNDKPYACTWPGCSYRSCSSSNLCKHIRIHNR